MKPHLFAMTPLLVALCLGPSPALAQVSEPDRAAARALGKEGHDALDNKDFATAADRFAKANAIIEAPTFLLGLAQAQVGLGKLVAAQETYGLILKDPLPESAPAAFVKAVETARTESAALEARLPHVIVQVAGAASVAITIDGEALSAAALGAKRAVDPGSHVIRSHGAGFEDLEIGVDSVEGKTQTVTLEPKPVAAPAASSPAPATSAPANKPEATPVLASAPAPQASPAPEAPGSARKTLGIVTLVLGGAGLGLGAAMGGAALAERDKIAPACPNSLCSPGRYEELGPSIDRYHLFGAVSTASLVAGGVLAGAGAVLVLTAPRNTKSTTTAHAAPWLTITPLFGPGYAGAKGSFQ